MFYSVRFVSAGFARWASLICPSTGRFGLCKAPGGCEFTIETTLRMAGGAFHCAYAKLSRLYGPIV
jgi:hypothetical protein